MHCTTIFHQTRVGVGLLPKIQEARLLQLLQKRVIFGCQRFLILTEICCGLLLRRGKSRTLRANGASHQLFDNIPA
jgi:hypothetical protein